MRRIPFVLSALAFLLAGAAFVRAGHPTPATAQTATPRPLMYNEIEEWCLDGPCHGVYIDLADGSVRVQLPKDEGFNGDSCPRMNLPDDVDGWAYAKVVDLGYLTFERPTPAPGQSQIDANGTALAASPTEDQVAVISVADARQLGDQSSICELVVRRSS